MIDRHMMIQSGMKTTTQLQVMKRSSRRAMKTNWMMFTAQKSSSSKLRSFSIAQKQMAIESSEMKISGMNASVHMCRPDSSCAMRERG